MGENHGLGENHGNVNSPHGRILYRKLLIVNSKLAEFRRLRESLMPMTGKIVMMRYIDIVSDDGCRRWGKTKRRQTFRR